jgi:surface protein
MLGIGNSISKISSSKISSGSFLFVFSIQTDNSGTSNTDQFTLPLTTSINLDITVEWGDGNTSSITSHTSSEVTHTYASSGEYTIKIDGTLKGFTFNNGGDKLKIKNVSNWGVMAFDATKSFRGCTNLTCSATDAVTVINSDLSGCFQNCVNFNGAISNWDVSGVTNMISVFNNASSFNQPLNSWNVSNVTRMNGMFQRASAFNQDLNNWNVSNVTNLSTMFRDAFSFSGNISSWDVSNVTTMQNMFFATSSFNGNISSWDVSSVTNMSGMFRSFGSTACIFNGDINGWDVSSVTNMDLMFANNDAFDQNVGSWNLSSLTNSDRVFLNVELSTANYDSTLIGWANTGVPNGLTFNFGISKYTSGGTAEAARNTLINTYNWTIIDGGTA